MNLNNGGGEKKKMSSKERLESVLFNKIKKNITKAKVSSPRPNINKFNKLSPKRAGI